MKQFLVALLMIGSTRSCGAQQQSTAAFNFFSYMSVPRAKPPSGAMFQINFPNQASGSQDVIPHCSTFGNLYYQWFAYDGTTWNAVPGSTHVDRSYTTYFQSATPVTFSKGMEINLSSTGVLGSATTGTWPFIQSWFWGSSQCYEEGPEIGFYRLLYHPGNATEQNTVYFYYGTDVNCYAVGALSSCRDRTTGVSVPPITTTQAITMPVGKNSKGGYNWLFNITLPTPSEFSVRIQDPYTLKDKVPVTTVLIDSFFIGWSTTLYGSGIPGYTSITQLRNSPIAALTDSRTNPLQIVTYGVKMK